MANISPNKIGDDEKRRAEHIEKNLRKQGMGEDQAEKEAMEAAVREKQEQGGNHGGNSSGGEPQKDPVQGSRRSGSDKELG